MQNIVDYFYYVLRVIFGNGFSVYSPAECLGHISEIAESSSTLESFLLGFLTRPELFLSYFVWTWFAILVFKLLLVYPFKWFKSVVKRK